MVNCMSNETEIQKIFRELNLENQADLLIRARKFQINQQRRAKNEETMVYSGNTGLHVGIRSGNGVCPPNDQF